MTQPTSSQQSKPGLQRVTTLVIAASAGIALLTGCATAQMKGLVVGGIDSLMPTHLSTATTDAVLQKGYELQQKPVCVAEKGDSDNFTCHGVTVDGQKIVTRAHETEHSKADMKITVGGKEIFDGTMAEIFRQEYEGDK